MNDIKTFNNPEFGSLRTVEVDGKPYFVGKDVAEILGYSNPRDAINRFFSKGVSLSLKASSSADDRVFRSVFPFFRVASYPASRTAAIISSESAVPSTPIELVSRLTEQEVTPLTPDTAFSTRAIQAAQLIPVTVYCSIVYL